MLICRKNHVKSRPVVTAKLMRHELIPDISCQKFRGFLNEVLGSGEKTIGYQVRGVTETFPNAQIPPKLKKSINTA